MKNPFGFRRGWLAGRLTRIATVLAVLGAVLGVGIEPAAAAGTVSISDVSQAEDNGLVDATFNFTVTMSTTDVLPVVVTYHTVAGSATATTDFTEVTTNTATIAAGQTTTTIPITVKKDSFAEPNESFSVVIDAVTAGTTIADATGVGTIENNDGPIPTFSIDNVTVTEGNAGSTTATFTVTLIPAVGQATSVSYSTANGTASAANGDYDVISATTLNFAASASSQQITVAVNADVKDEIDETYLVNLASASNAQIGDTQGVGTITDDDAQPTISIADNSVTEGNSGTTALTFNVALSAASGNDVQVNWATSAGTATAGTDYTTASNTLTIPADSAGTGTISIDVVGDTLDEANETFFVTLSSPQNTSFGDNQATGTINDNDAEPNLTIDNQSVTESDSGTQNMVFTVSLTPASGQQVTVDYATANNTATQPADYTAASGTLTFVPTDTIENITVPIVGDTKNEATTETFNVNLSNPTGAAITDSQGVGTITDNDAQPALSVSDATAVSEGNTPATINQTFRVSLSAVSGRDVTVLAQTTSGTATGGSDYSAVNQTVTIPAGDTFVDVSVTILGDNLDEDNETYTLDLSSPTFATIADGSGSGTINDDDTPPTASITDVTANEGDGTTGTTTVSFTVTLSTGSGRSVTMAYATSDDPSPTEASARAGQDYVAETGTVTFVAGDTIETITVEINNDNYAEPNETYRVTLSNPSGATLADATGLGTITNEDGGPPAISINNPSATTEGNSGTSNMVFTVSLSTASGTTVTVDYTANSGTATSGSDFTATSGTLTFVAGDTSEQITVSIIGDNRDEGTSESFTVDLTNQNNATVSDGSGAGTITDDDDAPSITIDDPTTTEGSSGTSTMTFTVSLSNPSASTVTVSWTTGNATATAGQDYTANSGTLTFVPDDTSETISVSIIGDTKDEDNESLLITLSAPSNATIGDTTGVGTITDDDAPPTLTINDPSAVTEGNSGTTTLTFTLTLSQASAKTIQVTYLTNALTATEAVDYDLAGGTIQFDPDVTVQTKSITVRGDVLDELDETFTLDIAAVDSSKVTISDSSGLGTIADDDAAPTLTVDDVVVTEGDSGTTSATFTLTLSAVSGRAIDVNLSTTGVEAAAGVDFTDVDTMVTIPAGQLSTQVTIDVLGDLSDEIDETYTVDVVNDATVNDDGVADVTVSDGQGLGTITDDDDPPTLSIGDVTVTEGDSGTTTASLDVTASVASGKTITVDYATAEGLAIDPEDFTTQSGTLTFVPDDGTETIDIVVAGDTIDETSPETFVVDLSNVSSTATIADSQATVSITDDDATPSISAADVTVTEGNSGTVTADFTVALSNPSSSTITVDYATSNGTASAPSDYTATSGTVTFAPGDTSETVSVAVAGDTTAEANQTFNLGFSNPANATVGDATAVGTITDDDSLGTFTPISVTKVLDRSIGGGQRIVVDVTGVAGVPETGVGAVAVNVSVLNATRTGYLSVTPSTTTRRTVELAAGEPASNLAVIPVGSDGKIRFYNSSGTSSVEAYLVGWYAKATVSPPASHFKPKAATGLLDKVIGANKTIRLDVTGVGGVPSSNVRAVALNISGVDPTKRGFISVGPEATSLRRAVELSAGESASHVVIVRVGSQGSVRIHNGPGSTRVVVQVVGWYGTAGTTTGSTFRSVTPAGLFSGSVPAGTTKRIDVTGRGGVPSSGVTAVVLNVAGTNPTVKTFLSLMPEATPTRRILSLNPGERASGLVIVPVGSLGSIRLRNKNGTAGVVVTVVGYYTG